ncbi:hypothetical protein [Cohnella candidum]|uniref:hypothetical protein n=1 Tax=Cohnella candidum TaxID=2674991 RepID=UPI001F14AA15|nr:hypothetical protein [Cohnella candidum]
MNDKDTFPSFIKEKWCIEQTAAVGVPGPEVLSMGIVDETVYMIQAFIEGDNGVDSTVPISIRPFSHIVKVRIQVKHRGGAGLITNMTSVNDS